MTPEDAQIDILLRRYARRAERDPGTQHLDADELNAFAEGAVPAEARSRYTSHLADCSHCRQLVLQLAMASGAAARAVTATALERKTESWRQRLAAFFRPPTLRYAAFALVLVAAAATVFVVMRRPRETAFLAQNESLNERPSSVAKQTETHQVDQNPASSYLAPTPESAQRLKTDNKKDELTVSAVPTSPPKPAAGPITSAVSPAIAKEEAKRAATEPTTAFAPPPPGEAGRQAQSREQQEPKSGAGVGGLRKMEVDKTKAMEQPRVAEFGIAKDRRAGPSDNSNQRNQQVLNQNTLSDTTTAARNQPAKPQSRARNEEQSAGRPAGSADRDDAEKAPETRSAGGHKFRRQGNIWVDTKYKSSMPIADVSRDSDEYRALGSSVKSIVEQLGGGMIIVSKGKAYRIR